MSGDHDHPEHEHGHDRDHGHEHPAPAAPEPAMVEDAGSRALAEALKSDFFIVRVVMVVLFGVFLFSGFSKSVLQERAIVLRFGAPVGGETKALLGPGLHWSLPYPIDEVVRIPYSEIQQVKSTVGWCFHHARERSARDRGHAGADAGLESGDPDGYAHHR